MNSNRRLTMPRKSSSTISAPDILKLLPSDNKNGFLRERCISKIRKAVKWKHRFVVLAKNAIYIYDNESSSAPNSTIPLLGYLAVERETTTVCPWGFALVPSLPSLKRKTFACSSDSDRKNWMMRIKDHLYTSNNVTKTNLADRLKEKLKLAEAITDGEREYLELELPIESPDDTTTETKSDSENPDDSDSSGEEDADRRKSAASDRKSVFSEKKQRSRDSDSLPESSLSPPRYSAVVEGEEVHYQNCATTPKAQSWGMERAATIQDAAVCRDRDKCIAMLKTTKRIGTYLIRKSRTGDYLVLSILTSEVDVKEFRIELSYGLYHFMSDPKAEFSTIDSLLAYYTFHKEVPNLNTFLGWGIHECAEGKDLYEHVDG